MSIFVIGDRDTVLGFRLVGAHGIPVKDKETASAELEKALQNEALQLLLITREWSDALRERIDRLKMDRLQPIVMEIPGKSVEPPERSLTQLVRRAIGINI
ncbi:MAG: V-type ATP synthase subunit F [Thermodesulfobacteriota bacterium]